MNGFFTAIKEFGSIKLLQHNNLSQKSNNVVQTFEMRKKKMVSYEIFYLFIYLLINISILYLHIIYYYI